jgi:tRNA-2-methylthio-N6-dimethylallyladenosine synthase
LRATNVSGFFVIAWLQLKCQTKSSKTILIGKFSPLPLLFPPVILSLAMKTYAIHTFGCQMNYSDSERIETYLKCLGLKKAQQEKEADLVIFNSCSIRQKAEDRVIGKMHELQSLKNQRKKKGKYLIIALTGCMVRKSSTKHTIKKNQDHFIKILKPLDVAFRIEELHKLKDLLLEASNKACDKSCVRTTAKPLVTFEHQPELERQPEPNKSATSSAFQKNAGSKSNTNRNADYFHITPSYTQNFQAFIPISTGCDKFCTYCIVPYSRGREVSRDPKEIYKEAEKLVKKGCKEITLLGQTVDSYGLSPIDRQKKLFDYNKIDTGDQAPPFVQLLESIDKLYAKGLRRLRFTSPHPKDVSQALINCYGKLKTLMPHIHLPVQSGDNACLKRMNRPYTRERYLEIIKALRKQLPDIAITTDIIVGFCGETEKEFQNSVRLYKEVGFDFAYLAQYSVRRGTFAAKHLENDVSRSEKARRWHKLNNLLTKITHEKLNKFVGKKVEVLVEKIASTNQANIAVQTLRAISRKPKNTAPNTALFTYLGRSPHMKEVQFVSPKKNLTGTLQKVKVTKTENWLLHGGLTK